MQGKVSVKVIVITFTPVGIFGIVLTLIAKLSPLDVSFGYYDRSGVYLVGSSVFLFAVMLIIVALLMSLAEQMENKDSSCNAE